MKLVIILKLGSELSFFLAEQLIQGYMGLIFLWSLKIILKFILG